MKVKIPPVGRMLIAIAFKNSYYRKFNLNGVFYCLGRCDSIDTDFVVRVTSKEGRAIRRPGEARASRDFAIFGFLRAQGIDNDLGFQIPDLDRVIGGGAQPISVW